MSKGALLRERLEIGLLVPNHSRTSAAFHVKFSHKMVTCVSTEPFVINTQISIALKAKQPFFRVKNADRADADSSRCKTAR